MSEINERWVDPASIDNNEQHVQAISIQQDNAVQRINHVEQQQGIRQAKRWRRHLSALAVGALLVILIWQAAENSAFDWPLVGHYLFDSQILKGLWTTLWLTALVTLLSVVFGVVIALMRLSRNPVVSLVAWGYIWLFRATPLLVQLLFWFNIGYLVPRLTLGWPGTTPWFSVATNDLISAIGASILGLTLHGMAYSAEFIRGGLLAVPQGQKEAATMLGLSPSEIFLRIILPQSLRTIIPALGNFLIDNLKGTSIISVVAVTELLYSAQLIYNRNYKIIPLLLVATFWYVAVTSLLSLLQHWSERYYGRGYHRK